MICVNSEGMGKWQEELIAAIRELALARDAHIKASGRLVQAEAAFTRAKDNAENSIVG